MEIADYLRFAAAFVFIIALIGGCAWGAKRFGLASRLQGGTTTTHRLSIVEIRPIDMKRKLILIRRDNVEHLILIGPDRELLIENAIIAPKAHPEARSEAQSENQNPRMPETASLAAPLKRAVNILKERHA